MNRHSHGRTGTSSTRSTRNQERAIRLKQNAIAAERHQANRYEQRVQWWHRTFQSPISSFNWVLAKAKGWVSAILTMMINSQEPQLGLLPRSSTIRRSKNRDNRKLNHEPLEARQLLAADLFYVANAGTNLAIPESQQVGDFTVLTDNGDGVLSDGDIVSLISVNGPTNAVLGTNAFTSIQSAIASATADKVEITVAPGTYAGNVDAVTGGKDVSLKIGNTAPGVVIIGGSLQLNVGDELHVRAASSSSADKWVVGDSVVLQDPSLLISSSQGLTASTLTVLETTSNNAVTGEFGNTHASASTRGENTSKVSFAEIVSDTDWSIVYNSGAGSNDVSIGNLAPVIISADLFHLIEEPAGNDPGMMTVSGTIQYSGPEFDKIEYGIRPLTLSTLGIFGFSSFEPNAKTVGWTYSISNAALKFLADEQIVTQYFRISVQELTGGSIRGAEDYVTVTISLRGLNDAPIASDLSKDVFENGELVNVKLPFTDQDKADKHTFEYFTEGIDGIPALKGLLTPSADGSTFTYSPNHEFDYLKEGMEAVEKFVFKVTDDSNVSSTATVTITIKGVNTAPTANDVVVEEPVSEDALEFIGDLDAHDVDSDAADFEYSFNLDESLGTVTYIGGGKFKYSPNGKFESLNVGDTASVSFDYTVKDNHGATATAKVFITIQGENDLPVPGLAETQEVAENETIDEFQLTATDIDNGHLLTYSFVNASPSKGEVNISEDGKLSFNPNHQFDSLDAGAHEDVTIVFKVTDEHGGSNEGSIVVRVIGKNSLPTAANLPLAVFEDSAPVDLSLSGTVVDADANDTHTFYLKTPVPDVGYVNLTEDGVFTYAPDGKFDGLLEGAIEEFDILYIVRDSAGAESTGTITVTVTGKNSLPHAQPATIELFEDDVSGSVQLKVQDDDIGDSHEYRLADVDTDASPRGVVSLQPNGLLTFSPAGDFDYLQAGEVATVIVHFIVKDSHGDEGTGQATITIKGKNSPPTAIGGIIRTNEDNASEPVKFSVDDDDANDSYTFELVSQPSDKGIVSISPDGNVTFDPAGMFERLSEGQEDSFTFTFKVTDSGGLESIGTGTVVIVGRNDAPVVGPSSVSVEDNKTVSGKVVASDVDEKDVLQYSVSIDPSLGLVSIDQEGEFTYNPNGAFDYLEQGKEGIATFTFTVTDGIETRQETVTVKVIGSNKSPAAVDDRYSTAVNTTLSIPAVFGLLSNDTGFKGRAISIVSIGTPAGNQPVGRAVSLAHGMLVVAADGSFTYMPNAYEAGTDTFTYTVSDGTLTSTATVTISILGPNHAPIAIADYAITPKAASVVLDVLFNDFDQDFDTLVLRRVNGVDALPGTIPEAGFPNTTGGGTVEIVIVDGRQKILYTPSATFVGVDQFSYLITDGRGGYAGAEAYVTVTGEVTVIPPVTNRLPVAVDDIYTVGNNAVLALGVLANDSDPDVGQTLKIQSVSVAGQEYHFAAGEDVTKVTFEELGELSFVSDSANTNFHFIPKTGAVGNLSFTYTITDQNGGLSTATVTISIVAANNAPVPQDDYYEFVLGSSKYEVSSEEGVLVGDEDPDGDTFSITLLSQPVSSADSTVNAGVVSLLHDGSFIFFPEAGFSGDAKFTYKLTDSRGASAVATVTLSLNAEREEVTPELNVESEFHIPEDSAEGTVVGQATVSGLGDEAYSLSLEGVGADFFAIDEAGVISVKVASLESAISPIEFEVVLTYGSGQTIRKPVSVILDESIVSETLRIENVIISSKDWNQSFKNYIHHGDSAKPGIGYVIPRGEMLNLPWVNINQIVLEFNQDVSGILNSSLATELNTSGLEKMLISADGLEVAPGIREISVVGQYVIFQLLENIGPSHLTLTADLSNLRGLDNEVVESEWIGANGTFTFKFNVLPGDVNGDGHVDITTKVSSAEVSSGTPLASDRLFARPELDWFSGSVTKIEDARYSPFRDLNGSSEITSADLSYLLQFGNKGL